MLHKWSQNKMSLKTCRFWGVGWGGGSAVFIWKTWKQKPSKSSGHRHWLLMGGNITSSILDNTVPENRALICSHIWEQDAVLVVSSRGPGAHQRPGMVTKDPYQCVLGSCCGGSQGPPAATTQSEAGTGGIISWGDMLIPSESDSSHETSPLGPLSKPSFWLLFKTNPAGHSGKYSGCLGGRGGKIGWRSAWGTQSNPALNNSSSSSNQNGSSVVECFSSMFVRLNLIPRHPPCTHI